MRLAAAFVAAAAVHALVFGVPARVVPAPDAGVHGMRVMPVQIVAAKAHAPMPPASPQPGTNARSRKSVPHGTQPVRSKRQKPSPKAEPDPSMRSISSIGQKPNVQSIQSLKTAAAAKQPANPAHAVSRGRKAEQPSASSPRQTVPPSMRSTFFAHIRYPWQARRMGWQGRVMIGFKVADRRIKDIQVLISSGHDVLDHAALRGIGRVQQIALADGHYSLPVRFVLR